MNRALSLTCMLWCAQIACKNDPPPPDTGEAPAQAPQPTAPSALISSWGDQSTHPARPMLTRCHVLSSQELSLLAEHFIHGYGGPPANRLHEIYGVTKHAGDSFAQERQNTELATRYEAEVKALLDDDLCVEYDLAIKGYDFKAARFPFVVSELTVLCPDCATWFGTRPGLIEPSLRASDLTDHIHLIAWEGMLASLPMDRTPAERLLDDLEAPVNSPEVATTTTSSAPAAARPDLVFKNGLDRLHYLIIHGEQAQLFGFAISSDSGTPPSTQDRDDEPNMRPRHETEYLEEVAEVYHEVRAHHRATVRVAIDLKQANTHSLNGVDVPRLFARPVAMAMVNTRGEVFKVWPDVTQDEVTPGRVLLSDAEDVLDVVCRGSTKRRTRTVMKQGKLVDETSYTCGRCPDLPGVTRRGPLELGAHVDRARLGTPWSTGWLVTGWGCMEEDVMHDESVAFYVSPGLDGRPGVSGVYPHLSRHCTLLERSSTQRDLLLCEEPDGEGPHTYIALVRLEAHNRRSHHDLSFYTGPQSMPCDGERVDAYVDAARSEDINADGIQDLVIHLKGEGACPELTLRYLGHKDATPATPLEELFTPDAPTAASLARFAP